MNRFINSRGSEGIHAETLATLAVPLTSSTRVSLSLSSCFSLASFGVALFIQVYILQFFSPQPR